MKTFILDILFSTAISLFIIASFDREIARRDYMWSVSSGNYNEVVGCIFKTNCDYYNKLLYEDIEEYMDAE